MEKWKYFQQNNKLINNITMGSSSKKVSYAPPYGAGTPNTTNQPNASDVMPSGLMPMDNSGGGLGGGLNGGMATNINQPLNVAPVQTPEQINIPEIPKFDAKAYGFGGRPYDANSSKMQVRNVNQPFYSPHFMRNRRNVV